jgi:peptide/nickel transport system permease protein
VLVAQYIIRRLLQAILVIIGVLTVVFIILRLTGDPVRLILGENASEEAITRMSHELGLDRPLYVQYFTYMSKVAQGDFGRSISQGGKPALPIVLSRYPATLQLALLALTYSVLLATIFGIISAIYRYSIFDNAVMFLALFGQSVPNFWLGIMLILIFAVNLGWLPSQGFDSWNPRYIILPMLALAGLARLTRLVRSGMLDVMGQDYVRTARAKGLNESRVVFRHALKNAAIPLVTIIGLDLGVLLGGAVVTEQIFEWPGVGRAVIEGINRRDFPVVQAAVFIIALTFVLINLAVDLLYTWLDPRVRLG